MPELGLIAGGGAFPLEVAAGARRNGLRVIAVAHLGETDPALEAHCDELTWVKVGEIQKLIDALKHAGVRRAAMAGGIARARLDSSFAPDDRALRILARINRLSDDTVLRGVAREIESEGIDVIDPVPLIEESLAGAGVLAGPQPTAARLSDLDFAFAVARNLGSFDIGQSVAVKDGVVAAVEAIEGTDRAIRRAATLCGPGLVVAKACKPGQDLRFDRPAIGPATIQLLAETGAALIGVEARRTLIIERPRTLRSAADLHVSVYGHA